MIKFDTITSAGPIGVTFVYKLTTLIGAVFDGADVNVTVLLSWSIV